MRNTECYKCFEYIVIMFYCSQAEKGCMCVCLRENARMETLERRGKERTKLPLTMHIVDVLHEIFLGDDASESCVLTDQDIAQPHLAKHFQ